MTSKDTRIFKVVYAGRRADAYKTRTAVSGMFSTSLYNPQQGKRADIKAVYATNAEATEGWTDVTGEFRDPQRPELQCPGHKAYTGVRKPSIWAYASETQFFHKRCTCHKVYAAKHPDYPTHWKGCDRKFTDPALCPCQLSKKLFGDGSTPEAW